MFLENLFIFSDEVKKELQEESDKFVGPFAICQAASRFRVPLSVRFLDACVKVNRASSLCIQLELVVMWVSFDSS